MTLREAVQAADLTAILERLSPESGARAGKRGRIKCVWRGGTDYSGNLFQVRSGQWKLHDFVTGETWDAFDVLTQIGGMSKAQAAAELTGERAIPRASITVATSLSTESNVSNLPYILSTNVYTCLSDWQLALPHKILTEYPPS